MKESPAQAGRVHHRAMRGEYATFVVNDKTVDEYFRAMVTS
jgi:hypothetical protein